MNAEHQKILDAITAVLPTIAPTDAQAAELRAALDSTKESIQDFRLKSLLLAGLHIEDSRALDPTLSKDALMRVVANEYMYMYMSGWLVRLLKRRAGDEISPARFALVAYGVAEHVLGMDWSHENDTLLEPADGSLREEIQRPSAPSVESPFIDIVFDGPPLTEGGRFIEVEDHTGASISVGEWLKREDGHWALRIPRS